MKATYSFRFFLLIVFAVGVTQAVNASPQSSDASSSPAQKQPQAKADSSAASKEALIERGKYLVTEVARCQYCHTPRDANGEFDRSRWLQGAPVWIIPAGGPKPGWAVRAPEIAGLPFSDEQALDVLEKGVATTGQPVLPPMHRYHLKHEDALAIIAYLRSLPRPARRY